MLIRGTRLELKKYSRPVIMGILNITPDSFSDGGRNFNIADAIRSAEKLIRDGADILDIGAESTRPGAEFIDEATEKERLLPVLRELRKSFDIPISVDTYKAGTAEVCLNEGADIINDIWGLKYASDMAKVCASYGCPVVIMHNRQRTGYNNLLEDIISDMKESVAIAKDAGIRDENIIIDPGIGFAKSLEENILLMRQLEDFNNALPYPSLLGISRKSIIGKSLNLPVDNREDATVALNVYGYMKGCSIFRVHDAAHSRQALDMISKVLR